MASLNIPKKIKTHEGAPAYQINAEQQLRRSVMSCLLWEKTFYEDGEDIAKRISGTIAKVKPQAVSDIAIEARGRMKLRHVPLLIVREMARLPEHKKLVEETLFQVIQRPDEITEFLAIYWKDGRCPLANSVKRGLARAFGKFNEYSLAKYNRDGAIKLRDAIFLCHAKPDGDEQAALFKKLVDGTLAVPDTWEVELSSSKDKVASWARLLSENKLGALALIRNLRNMVDAGVDSKSIKSAILSMKTDRVLPYRFIAAARYAPKFEPELEQAMFRCVEGMPKLPGETILMIDVSGSMDCALSGKSEMVRIDAANGLAIILREICESVRVVTFSDNLVEVPPRRGFALRDAIKNSQTHNGTNLGGAVRGVMSMPHDRLIVISDEQSQSAVPNPLHKSYMINVSSEKNGVGYGAWDHIDGFSESIVDYIFQSEAINEKN